MTTWEYHIVRGNATLTELGQQGWELVAVIAYNTDEPTFYFKRPTVTFRDRVTEEQKRRYYQQRGVTPHKEAT